MMLFCSRMMASWKGGNRKSSYNGNPHGDYFEEASATLVKLVSKG